MDTVYIDQLPQHIQKQIPLSIRTYKNEYELNTLPSEIQFIVKDYLILDDEINYGVIFDIRPEVSEYGDFETIKTVYSVVLEYLKNYFLTLPGDYPFDPSFGSKMKTYLHTKDTSLRQTMISSEIDSIVNVVKADLGVKITIINVSMKKKEDGSAVEYYIVIELKINDNKMNMNFNV